MVAVDDAAAFPSRREAGAPLVAALVTVVLWASAFVGIRTAGEEISPGALALGRLVVGGSTLAILLRLRGEHLPARATLACLPFAPTLAHDLAGASAGSLAWLVYLGVFPTALAFTTWAYALARTNAGRLAATTYLVPPLSILLGWTLLGETPPALALAGGALCLLGVGVSRRR